MCWDFPSTNALITFPNALKDKFIFVASFNLSPYAPVLLNLSLPAKSTRFSFPNVIRSFPFSSIMLCSTYKVNILWLLLLSLFINVSPTDLYLYKYRIYLYKYCHIHYLYRYHIHIIVLSEKYHRIFIFSF